jgi:Protein of unknown function (DUF2905)
MGPTVIKIGILIVVVGMVILGAEKVGIRLGRLPGDIRVDGKNGGFYFPVVTCILISLILTLISMLFNRR